MRGSDEAGGLVSENLHKKNCRHRKTEACPLHIADEQQGNPGLADTGHTGNLY